MYKNNNKWSNCSVSYNQTEVAEELPQQEVWQEQSSELNQTEVQQELNYTDFSEVGEDLPQQEVWQEQSSELNQTEVQQELNYTDFSEPESIDLHQPEAEQQLEIARQAPSYSVAQLMGCVQSQDKETRKFAASALGQMAAANACRSESQRAIETLGKLARRCSPGGARSCCGSTSND